VFSNDTDHSEIVLLKHYELYILDHPYLTNMAIRPFKLSIVRLGSVNFAFISALHFPSDNTEDMLETLTTL